MTLGTPDPASVLAPLFAAAPPPFALIRREGARELDLLLGEFTEVPTLDAIPLPDPDDAPGTVRHDVLALVPYRQIRERGFEARDDGTPLLCLRVTSQVSLAYEDVLAALPDTPVVLEGGGFDVDDATYADIVGRVIADEIGRGEGANFVVRRDYRDRLADYSPATAGTLMRRLLTRESGAYWTYLIHTGDLTLVGASPERHVSATGGDVVMNPISGTYRYPADGPDRDGLLAFLRDGKEVDELFMVVDEELKMMSEVCDLGGQVLGPYLKEMGHLAHTEYVLRGRSSLDVRTILRGTMFAPTVTGSPLENACRVIRRHEPTGRGYYSGVLALIGRDAAGRRTLDAPILIRTAYVSPDGTVRVPAGATLVRHSDPAGEVAETHAKAAGVLSALGAVPAPSRSGARAPGRLSDDPEVASLLAARNAALSPFWLTPRHEQDVLAPELAGRPILVVDGEDTFTAMLAHLLRTLGLRVTVRPYDEVTGRQVTDADLLLVGPGPGDPRRAADRRIRRMGAVVRRRLDAGGPLFGVCLGHQLLAAELGLDLVRKDTPYQGKQLDIDLFGREERVGFYNTFAATATERPRHGLEFSAAPDTSHIHAMRGKELRIAGVQFHPESVLTRNGAAILRGILAAL
ncbi:anthranilate synthase family protein [Yinghuangia sp. ASG 101]|uniref:anthranilate synthase family protein n=1 Tax=Yinghuangia sp. ASG 101 TaxID=2896848 RepID=UPI001E4DD860|nr:anthranilate synthase family protein [Yinghuangia sp. ASG 101]UGQ10005.1 anthranilate synthase family protein [Yinghuangia sp. ASG 101]